MVSTDTIKKSFSGATTICVDMIDITTKFANEGSWVPLKKRTFAVATSDKIPHDLRHRLRFLDEVYFLNVELSSEIFRKNTI